MIDDLDLLNSIAGFPVSLYIVLIISAISVSPFVDTKASLYISSKSPSLFIGTAFSCIFSHTSATIISNVSNNCLGLKLVFLAIMSICFNNWFAPTIDVVEPSPTLITT